MIDFYEYYGVSLTPASEVSKDQYKGDCPFCGKEGHFYVDPVKGLFDCKKCGIEGNNLTFITELHKMHLSTTTDEEYLKLASARPGITVDALKQAEWAYDSSNGAWYVPYQNGSAYLNNLGRFNPSVGFRIYKGPGLGLKLYRPFDKKSFQETVVICEGEWDLLAIYPHLKQIEPDFSVCSVPGSNTFKDEYLEHFRGKNVILMYDKDDAGKKGIAKASRKLHDVAASVRFLKWDMDEKFPNAEGEEDIGKDLRDYVVCKLNEHKNMASKRKPKVATMIWGALILQCVSPETDQGTTDSYLSDRFSLPPVANVTSWEDYIKVFRENLYLTPSNEHALACVLATTISPHFPGEPIWLFLVGPASCLSRDSVVKINRSGKTFDITLEDLYHRFHGGVAGGKIWNPEIPTKIQQRKEDGTIRLATVHRVIYSGKKIVYELETETGRRIKASADHRFMIDDGSWVELRDLKIGDYLLTNQGRSSRGTKRRRPPRVRCGLLYHPHASDRKTTRSEGWTHAEHRLVVEADMNGLSFDEYIRILRYEPKIAATLKFIPKDCHVHHKDRDNHNNSLDNLELLSKSDHFRLHCEEDNQTSHVLERCLPDRIIRIEEIGVEDVYDLTVDDPHNFLCEGIVVHNCGKTTLIESFGDSNMYVDAQSEISARSLVSGYKTSDGKDISYLPTLNNRSLMIKDFTTILTKSAQEQDELFGILRDAFDGSYKKQYGNNQHRFYKDLKFGLVAGVTKAIHAQNRSSLGERFLKIEYLDKSEFDEYLHIKSALSSVSTKDKRGKILIEHSLGYLDYLMNNLPDFLPNLSGKFEYKISLLAMLVARLRSQVERRRDDSLLYRPEWEVASRLAVQFKKMAQCLMIVYNKTEPDNQLYLTIRKLALDSCIPFNIEFAKRMYAYPNGITRSDLAEQLQLPATNVHRLLTDLMQLGLIRMKQIKSNKVGRPIELYFLDYSVQNLWSKTIEEDFDDNPLPPEPLKSEIPRRIRRQKT